LLSRPIVAALTTTRFWRLVGQEYPKPGFSDIGQGLRFL
jgi:hypothetical protein